MITLPEYQRERPVRTAIRQLRHALQVVREQRPRVIVTSGAGVTVAFCVVGRIFGAKIVYCETMARIDSSSAAGWVLSRLARTVLVQWPEMLSVYPHARLCRPALLEGIPSGIPEGVGGTFVAVGTHAQPFNRLLAMADDAAEAGLLPGPVIAQTGHSTYWSRNLDASAWMSPAEVADHISRSRYVVCHAGSGLISTALRSGRRPLILPRRAEHDEHVDDHQCELVAKLGELNLAVPLSDHGLEAEDLGRAEEPFRHTDQSGVPTVADAIARSIDEIQSPGR